MPSQRLLPFAAEAAGAERAAALSVPRAHWRRVAFHAEDPLAALQIVTDRAAGGALFGLIAAGTERAARSRTCPSCSRR